MRNMENIHHYYEYGTAGYRGNASCMKKIAPNVGVLAALRSATVDSIIGIMITASHNCASENGFKMIDPNGEMMESSWEKIGDQLINLTNSAEMICFIKNFCQTKNIELGIRGVSPRVIIGYDTRDSSINILQILLSTIRSLAGQVMVVGLCTTPELHHAIYHANQGNVCDQNNYFDQNNKFDFTFVNATQKSYFDTIITQFNIAMKITAKLNPEFINNIKQVQQYVDCSNGVGALAMRKISRHINLDTFILINNLSGPLNDQVGADFVKTNQRLPKSSPENVNEFLIASLDGDADRVVFCYQNHERFHLLDGDKMCALLMKFVIELLNAASIFGLSVGVVQTAYANGASTAYFSNLNIPIICSQTGVKYLHEAAKQFDIGIYFEANGHGTILFSAEAFQIVNLAETSQTQSCEHVKILQSVMKISNQHIGDGICAMLLCKIALVYLGTSISNWCDLYEDYASNTVSVKVTDKSIFKTSLTALPICLKPIGLQTKINELIDTYQTNQGEVRVFVRPSGTEDCIRIYIECKNIEKCKQIKSIMIDFVQHYAKLPIINCSTNLT